MGFVTVAEKLAAKGFHVAENELALAKRMDIATREITSGVEKLSPTTRKTLQEGYQSFLKAAPEGTNAYDALRTFTKEARDDFRREYPTKESADAAFQKFQVAMSEAVRRTEGLDSKATKVEKVASSPAKPVSNITEAPKTAPKPAADGPHSPLGDYDAMDVRQIAREQREAAKAMRTAQFEADVAIGKSTVAMDAIAASRRGKMNVETFFESLQGALSTKGLLKKNIGEVNKHVEDARQLQLAKIEQTADDLRKTTGDVAAKTYKDAELLKLPIGRAELKSPKDIRNLIVDGQPVTIDEIATARKYFTKYHNDSSITETIPDTGKLSKVKGFVSLIHRDTKATPGQVTEYTTGKPASFLDNARANPISTGVKALLWTTALSTAYTTVDYQHPKPLGSLIPGMIMDADDIIGQGDGIKGFAEYILYRYKNPISGESEALPDLKKYYGIDKIDNLDQKGREDVVEKIRGNSLLRTDMTPDVQTALTLYVGERLFTKVTRNPDELQDALNEWKAKNNAAIDKQKDEHIATEKKFEAKVAENAQGAIEHGVPTTLFTGKVRETDSVYKESDKDTIIEFADFTNRAKGVLYNNPEMQQALSKKFTEIAGADQVMDSKEASEFQKNANEMLTKSGFAPEKATKTVNFLMGLDR